MYGFQPGKAYFATPAHRDCRKIVLACLSRRGRHVTFSRVEGVYRVPVGFFDGRETAQVEAKDGLTYTASAVCEADVENAAAVMEAMG